MTNLDAFTQLNQQAVDAAARLSRVSLANAERVMALQIEFVKGTLDQATRAVRESAGVSDVQQLLALRTKSAESAVERLVEYSRNLYEISSEAQSQFSKFAEERMATFQQAMAASVEQASKSAPPGSDAAVTAAKTSLAATTAAFDAFAKAARQMASYADAGHKAATVNRKGRK